MRLKVILVLVLCLLVVSTVYGKKKKDKGKKRNRHPEPVQDDSEVTETNHEETETNHEETERRHSEDESETRGNGGKKGKGKKGRAQESSEEQRGHGSKKGKKKKGHSRNSSEEEERPPCIPISSEELNSKEISEQLKAGPRGRRRLMKEDSKRYSAQQNGPMPPGRNVEAAEVPNRLQIGTSSVSSSSTVGGTPNRLGEEEKGIFLEAHNQFRSEVRPYSSNMVILQWDDALANMAQGWADRCTFSHGNPDNISPFGYVGQNLWAGSGPTSSWNYFDMVKSWNDEKEYYDYYTDSCSGVCGHYTQLAWAETTHVGCALATCSPLRGLGWSPASILVCNYGEGGNYIGQKPYLSGSPCSQCPSDYNSCIRTQLCTPPSHPGNSQPTEPVDPPQGGNNQEPPDHVPNRGNQDPPQSTPAPGCGGTLTATTGEITSPNFPLPYDNDLDCVWTIEGGRNAQISLQFLFMDIETASQCPWDFLLVGADDLNDVKYCGTVPPAPIQSVSNTVRVEFTTDYSITRGGFKIRYMIHEEAETEEETCGGAISGTKGTLTSPGYPENYSHNLDCMWTIQVANDKRVRITFRAMDIEDHDSCYYDSLSIQLGNEKIPMRLCGSDYVQGKPYISLTNEMQLHFKTDNQGAASGFSINWKAI